MCVQEEERIKGSHGGDSVNHVKHNYKKKNYSNNSSYSKYNNSKPSSSKPHGKAPKYEGKSPAKEHEVDKDTCRHCKEKEHYMKDCVEFLKWINRNGKDIIICIDESLYLEYSRSTW